MNKKNQNCNLDLCLVPPSSNSSYHPDPDPVQEIADHHDQKQQKLTIFYNGNINVSNVTEFQAREIIMVASRETDRIRSEEKISWSPRPVPTPEPSQLICSNNNNTKTNNGSMQRSLHRFLQMRKNRIQSTSPYAR